MPGLSVLAHEWGDLKEGSPLQVIDKELQKFVQFSLEALEERIQEGEDITWDNVIRTFNQNIYMDLDESRTIEKTEQFHAQVGSKLNIGRRGRGQKDEDVVKEVRYTVYRRYVNTESLSHLKLEAWLRLQLVVDPNIIESSKLNIPLDRVTNIVARTGPICYKHIRLPDARPHGLDFVDVGIIRYPTFANPYIQVCLDTSNFSAAFMLIFIHSLLTGVSRSPEGMDLVQVQMGHRSGNPERCGGSSVSFPNHIISNS